MFEVFKKVFLSRNLDQNLPKNANFFKSCKIRLSVGAQSPTPVRIRRLCPQSSALFLTPTITNFFKRFFKDEHKVEHIRTIFNTSIYMYNNSKQGRRQKILGERGGNRETEIKKIAPISLPLFYL